MDDDARHTGVWAGLLGFGLPIAACSLLSTLGPRLVQVVAQVPPGCEVERGGLHERALGAEALKEQDGLQLEAHHGIDGRPARGRVAVADQLADKREVESAASQITVQGARYPEHLERQTNR